MGRDKIESGQAIYLAGEQVPPGHYQQIDGSHNIVLEQEDYLPAALDGHPTAYVLVPNWKKQEYILASENDPPAMIYA